MIKIAIVGATGYAGEELLKILVNHPQAQIVSVSAKVDKPRRIDRIFPHLAGKTDLICTEPDFTQIIPKCELAFLALPHRVSMQVAPKFLQAKVRVIDLSADYRLKNISLYEQYYGCKHKSKEYIKQAVYGLPELYKEKIQKAQLIANPGCYPTGAILAMLPLLKKGIAKHQDIIVDAKSGLSGAGREKEKELISKMQENFCAYKVAVHQHAPEIEQELSNIAGEKVAITFTPHLIPIQRGILSTIYVQLKKALSEKDILGLYQDCYQNAPFVKILPAGVYPQLRDVAQTNFCHLGLKVNAQKQTAIIISAIDNLVKGASGQAVQNMNLMFGFKESEALE